ncbi:NAD-dependent epimerase/dehydratase family protein [Streptosporangium sp. NPDC002607]
MISGKRILVTGASGSIGSAFAAALAPDNEVWGLARFTDPGAKNELEARGVRPIVADLGAVGPDDLSDLPEVDHVLHFAADIFAEPDFERAFRNNAEAAGLLMSHYRGVESFLHCSSTVVYEAHPEPRCEDHPLGDYMRAVYPTYSVSKIAGEAVVCTCARLFGIPTTIARLNVPYSDTMGFPWVHLMNILKNEPVGVYPDFPDVFAPIHVDDMVRTLPALLGAADNPPVIVNWGGDEPVGITEWSGYLAQLVGRKVTFFTTEMAIKGMCPDVGKLRELVGGPISSISWRDGLRSMVSTVVPAGADAP